MEKVGNEFPFDHEVAKYLREDPKFFERHPALLADLYLPSPHGKSAVSLAERQQLAQRDKIRVLEAKMQQLLQYGKKNDELSAKLHEFILQLLQAKNLMSTLTVITNTMQQEFAIPHVAVRTWKSIKARQDTKSDIVIAKDSEIAEWVKSLVQPYCGKAPHVSPNAMFGPGAEVKSCAILPLECDLVFGLLALGSDDESRFEADMGVAFLKRIGELTAAAIERYCQV